MIPYLYILNILLFGYALFCNLLIFFYSAPDKFYIEELYWPFMLALLSVAIYQKEKKLIIGFRFYNFLKQHVDVFFILFAVMILRIFLMNDVEVWLDEDYQAHAALISGPLIAGAFQHQPPMDLTFTKIGTLLSNENLWGLRLHSVIFSSLASALLYSLVKKILKSSFAGIILTFFFTLHIVVIQYGYEARPISVGLFYCLSFFGIILSLLSERQNSFYFKTPVFVSMVTFLFLNSLGMQPVILTGISIGFLGTYCLLKNSWAKSPLLSIAFGFILFLPIQIYILKYSPPRFTKHVGFDLFSFAHELMDYTNYKLVETYLWPLGYLFLAFCLLFFIFSLLRRLPLSSSIQFLFIAVVGFTLFLVPFFKSHIDWTLYNRYFALLLVPVFLGVAVALRTTLDSFNNRIWLQRVFVVVFFGATAVYYDWGPLTGLPEVYKQFQIKNAYEILNENSTDRDIDLAFCLNVKPWCAESLVMQSFYYKKASGGIVSNWKSSLINTYEKALNEKSPVENIYFFYYWVWSNNRLNLDGAEVLSKLRGVDVLKLAVKNGNLPQTMIDFCIPVVEKGIQNGVLYTGPVEYIVASASALGLSELKNHYLTLYKNFTGPKNDSVYLNRILEL